jgi:chaperonin cofactor prefoldin
MPGSRDRDDLTPITDISGMGAAIALIKRDVVEMKPEVKGMAKAVIELSLQREMADKRISTLESTSARLDRTTTALSSPRPHDCLNANKISDMNEEAKGLALGVIEAKKGAGDALEDIAELKKGQSKFIYWLLGAALVVIASVVGWYASYQVTTNEVRHLTVEQSKIRGQLAELQKTTKALPGRLTEVTRRVEVAANRIDEDEQQYGGVKLEDIWCAMSFRERSRLERSMPLGKLPDQKCGR